MMNEEVRTIMSTKVTTVSPKQTVDEVLNLMERKRLQQLPVVEHGKLVGLITTYDLWKNCRSNPNCSESLVGDVMTAAVVKLAPKDKVGTAAELFMDRRIPAIRQVIPKSNMAESR